MQLVLDDEIRRLERDREKFADVRFARAVEAILVLTIHPTEEGTNRPGPRHGSELVYRGDQKARQPAVDRLIDGQDRQGVIAGEGAVTFNAGDSQVRRV